VPVSSSVTVRVTGQLPGLTMVTTTPGEQDVRSCDTDTDCVPDQCCHPTGCINRAYRGVCTLLCTNSCEGPIDCGAGHCGCLDGRCTVIPGTPRPGR
jgi:hypothetical protein